MNYYFIKPYKKELDEALGENHTRHSSDLSYNPEGYILSKEEFEILKTDWEQHYDFDVYQIPSKYQDNINGFITDFWDGDVVIHLIHIDL